MRHKDLREATKKRAENKKNVKNKEFTKKKKPKEETFMNSVVIKFKRKLSAAMILFVFLLLGFHSTFVAADGQGTFIDSGQRLGNSDSYSPALGDVDGDGDLDAWVANYGCFSRHPNKVWLNNGNGTFIDSGQSLGSYSSRVSVLGDVDSDGDMDVFVGNGLEQPDTVWENDGSGVFSDTDQRLGRVATDDLELVDLNGDGHLDAFIASASDPHYGNPANLVFWGSLTGTFSDSGQLLGSSLSESVALGDLDSDGDLDAFVGNRAPFPDKVWWNNGVGIFADSGQSLNTGQSFRVALGDLDGDGDLDAFIADFGSSNTIWLNNGLGGFIDSGQRLGSSNSFDVKIADLDADGDLDAFVANSSNQPNTVWWNDGSGLFTDSGQRLGNFNSRQASLADLDGDGDLDAFVANHQPNTVWFYNRPPIAADDIASTDQDLPLTIDVLTNDFDPDGDSLTVESVTQGASGAVINNGDGTVTYTRNPGFNGTDLFIYTISDGKGGSATAKVSVTITPDIVLNPGASLGSNAIIGAGSQINNGVSIGDDAQLGDNVIINKNAAAGDNLSVGSETTINQNTVLGDGVAIGANVSIGKNCVIGNAVLIGDNTVLGQRCIIGDNASIGANVVINRDVTVLADAIVPDSTVVKKGLTVPPLP